MTRVPEVTSREELAPEHRPAFDDIQASRGTVSGPFKVLLNSPEVARRIAHTGAYLRFENSIPLEVSELAVLATARELDCQFAWTAHERAARTAGVREEAIVAIRERTAPRGLNPGEALVFNYAQELLWKHRVSQNAFQAALQRFGAKQLTDLTATIGYYSLLSCVLNAFEVQPEGTPLLRV